jgi:carboxyl-terminal processing protease
VLRSARRIHVARRRFTLPITLSVLVALSGCGGGSSSTPTESTAATATDQCSTLGQVEFVRTTLQDIYLWYTQLPDPDPAGFNSPEAYLDAVRYSPIDTSYSYIASKAASDAFFSDSQFIGIGVSYRQTGASELRVVQTFDGSPAADAGMARGDYIEAINGRTTADLLSTGGMSTIFGPDEVGVPVTMAWRTPGGPQQQATLVKRLVTIPTVSTVAVYKVGGLRVGYIFFRNFVTPSIEALNAAFDQLLVEGATDLVLDLRYNGGGFVSVAQHLGSLIGGRSTSGETLVRFTHNDKNTARNDSVPFEDKPNALEVPQLVVITTGGSASASELIINGLRPFMNVTVVGSRTFGKPVGQYNFDFCAKVLFPVSFVGENAAGEADYFDGIPADCAAPDDLDHAIGDTNEASLAEALSFLRTGRCSATAGAEAEIQSRQRVELPEPYAGDGWRQLLGAH